MPCSSVLDRSAATICTHTHRASILKWRDRQKQWQKGRPQEPAADSLWACVRLCVHTLASMMHVHVGECTSIQESLQVLICVREREREGEWTGRSECHGVCESELVGVCPLEAFRQNRLDCAGPTETSAKRGRKEGRNIQEGWTN